MTIVWNYNFEKGLITLWSTVQTTWAWRKHALNGKLPSLEHIELSIIHYNITEHLLAEREVFDTTATITFTGQRHC